MRGDMFPDLGPKFYSDNTRDRNVKEFINDFWYDSLSINEAYQVEADIDTRMEAGDTGLYQDYYSNISAFRRHQMNINLVRPLVNVVAGCQERTRKGTVISPVESGAQDTADQFTKLMMGIYRREGINETFSDAFHGSLVTGLNLLHVYLDFRNDPISGDLKVDRKTFNSFLIDPFMRKADMSDCRALHTRTYQTRAEVMSLWPDLYEMIADLPADALDGRFMFMPESFDAQYRNLMSYDEFSYRSYREQKLIRDDESGKSFEWDSESKAGPAGLRQMLSYYPMLKVIDQVIPTVKTAILVQGKVIYDGPNLLGIDRYNYVPVFTYYDGNNPYYPLRVQGMVRSMRDPQVIFTHRLTTLLDCLDSQPNSGWMFKEGAPIDPNDLFKVGNGGNIAVNADFSLQDIVKIPPVNIPDSWFKTDDVMGDLLYKTTGVNEELMGQNQSGAMSGIQEMWRSNQSLTSLQRIFSKLDASQKLLGNVILEAIQVNYTADKVERMIQEQPTDEFYNKDFGMYQVDVEAGFNTETQKQQQLAQMLQLRELGVAITDVDLLDACTLQNKNKIIERMEKEQQEAAQAKQAAEQAQAQQMALQTELIRANAHAQQGLGDERYSRIEENSALAVERLAQADRDEMTGLMNLVKAMKEIQNADLSQADKLVDLHIKAKQFTEATRMQEQANQQDNMRIANTPQQPEPQQSQMQNQMSALGGPQ